LIDLAFPIAEILPSGECFITKPDTSAGIVNNFNATAQLLYELQGELYLNPDVVADMSKVRVDNTSEGSRVFVSGVKGLPPPATTKAMIAARGGFQCETMFYINGLDVAEKAEMMRNQLLYMLKDSNFSKLSIELYGTPAVDPKSQQSGTVFLRVFAQARRKEDVSATKFRNVVYALRMQSYPGMAWC
jgi:Acyclic terpene utilisation family protein AtuA